MAEPPEHVYGFLRASGVAPRTAAWVVYISMSSKRCFKYLQIALLKLSDDFQVGQISSNDITCYLAGHLAPTGEAYYQSPSFEPWTDPTYPPEARYVRAPSSGTVPRPSVEMKLCLCKATSVYRLRTPLKAVQGMLGGMPADHAVGQGSTNPWPRRVHVSTA